MVLVYSHINFYDRCIWFLAHDSKTIDVCELNDLFVINTNTELRQIHYQYHTIECILVDSFVHQFESIRYASIRCSTFFI